MKLKELKPKAFFGVTLDTGEQYIQSEIIITIIIVMSCPSDNNVANENI